MFNPSRDQVRIFFLDAWDKAIHGKDLSPAEKIAADWIMEHPEYQDILGDREAALAKDYLPEDGHSNPFLHLSMHLAVAEQVSIDQPPGIRAAFTALCIKTGSEHQAAHRVFECLAEQIWQQQKNGRAFDSAAYIDCLRKDGAITS